MQESTRTTFHGGTMTLRGIDVPQNESVDGRIVTQSTFERLLTAQAIIRASRDAWAERKGTDDPLIRKLTTAMINAFDKQLDLIDEELNHVIADITAGTGEWK
jgi:hypothetical protein